MSQEGSVLIPVRSGLVSSSNGPHLQQQQQQQHPPDSDNNSDANILSINSQANRDLPMSKRLDGSLHQRGIGGRGMLESSDNHPIITIAVPDHHLPPGGAVVDPMSSFLSGTNFRNNDDNNNNNNNKKGRGRGDSDADAIEMKQLRSISSGSGTLSALPVGTFDNTEGGGDGSPTNKNSKKKGIKKNDNRKDDSGSGTFAPLGSLTTLDEDITPETFEVTPLDQIIRDKAEEYDHRNLSLWERASWRPRVYAIVEPYSFSSDIPRSVEFSALAYSLLTAAVVLISCVSIMGSSYSDYVMVGFPPSWTLISSVCVAFFTIDTLIRFLASPNRFTFLLDITIICDIIAVIPFYMSLFGHVQLFFWIRMLRVVRLIKLVKIFKGSTTLGLRSFILALQHSVEGMFVFLAIAVTSMLILSTCTYFAERGKWNAEEGAWYRKCLALEHCNGPDNTEESPFQSISDAFWYTIVTMCTTGFGDQYPKTGLGQFVGGCTMLMGIFLMALPTMILSGHYDTGAADGHQRSTHLSWKYLYNQNVARLSRPPIPMKEQLMRRKGWSYKDERQRLIESIAVAKRRSTIMGGGGMGGGPRGSVFASATAARRRRSSVAKGLNGKDPLAVAEAFEEFAANIDIAIDEKPIAVFKIPNSNPSQLGYLRRTKDPRRFLYDPIMTLVRDEEGRPLATAVLGTDGMPSCVRFDILIDTPEAQAQAEAAAKHIHPGATAEVDNGGGWRIHHHTPLDSLKAVVISTRPSARYVMLEVVPRAGYRDPRASGVGVKMSANNVSIGGQRSSSTTTDDDNNKGGRGGISPAKKGFHHAALNSSSANNDSALNSSSIGSSSLNTASTLPIYFMRIPYNDTVNRELTHECRYLKASDVIEECMNTILGSSLVITRLLPSSGVRRRIPVVLQMLENSRFHNEMIMIASKTATDEDVGKERTAFITQSDALRLLRGIHQKVDLYDNSLELEDPDEVDFNMSMIVLSRLRRTAIATIPPKQRKSIYNEEVLSSADTVIEVPLSLFDADEDDNVEEDALGYVELTARSSAGSSIRIDFAVETVERSNAATVKKAVFHHGDSSMLYNSPSPNRLKRGLPDAVPMALLNPFPSPLRGAAAEGGNLVASESVGGLGLGVGGVVTAAAGRSPITWNLPDSVRRDHTPRGCDAHEESALYSPRTPLNTCQGDFGQAEHRRLLMGDDQADGAESGADQREKGVVFVLEEGAPPAIHIDEEGIAEPLRVTKQDQGGDGGKSEKIGGAEEAVGEQHIMADRSQDQQQLASPSSPPVPPLTSPTDDTQGEAAVS